MSASDASALANSGSLAFSPGAKRTFSSMRISPSTMRVDGLVRVGSDDVVDEDDVAADEALQHAAHGPQRVLRVRLALRPAEMRAQDDPRPVVDQVADRRQRRANARVVGDRAVGDRHVEVDAHEHALAFDVDVLDGLLREHAFLRRRC